MDAAQALAVVRSLANGVDPESGEVFPPESTYQRPQVVRALYEAATALERIGRFERRKAPPGYRRERVKFNDLLRSNAEPRELDHSLGA